MALAQIEASRSESLNERWKCRGIGCGSASSPSPRSSVQEIVKHIKILRTQINSLSKNGNYSNVVCVMWTQFIKIFLPRLSFCLFTRSFCCLLIFSHILNEPNERQEKEKEKEKRPRWRKDMRWKKIIIISIIPNGFLFSHPSISGATASDKEEESNFQGCETLCCCLLWVESREWSEMWQI